MKIKSRVFSGLAGGENGILQQALRWRYRNNGLGICTTSLRWIWQPGQGQRCRHRRGSAGQDRAMARVGVEHGLGPDMAGHGCDGRVGLDLGLGLDLDLGLDGWGLGCGLDAGALAWGGRGTPTPPIERVPCRACLICLPQPSKLRRGPRSRPLAGVPPGAPSPGVPD